MRITLKKIQALDEQEDKLDGEGCRVRLIEMMVDSACDCNVGVSIQFWRDVDLYGLKEAVMLLEGYCTVPQKLKDATDFVLLEAEHGIVFLPKELVEE